MRSRSGCKSCRTRHVKCVKTPGVSKCQKCHETGRQCVWDLSRGFRPQTSVRSRNGDGYHAREDLTYNSSHTWVVIPHSISFLAPNSRLGCRSESSGDDEAVESFPSPGSTSKGQSGDAFLPHGTDSSLLMPSPSHQEDHSYHTIDVDTRESQLQKNDEVLVDEPLCSMSLATVLPQSNLSQSYPLDSSEPTSVRNPQTLCWSFDLAQARLLKHYVQEISPWLDVCDKHCRFGREVPKRVAHHPVVANAIYALASKHISLVSGEEDRQSSHYLHECLQTLIVALEDPLGHWDENLLIAVIILRAYEEMSDNDERNHLLGSSRILNSIAAFAADGGLRESASWLSLRQHIYISLTSQQPLDIHLRNYRHSSAFQDSDDEAWANRIVFIFADILTHVFQPNGSQADTQHWLELKSEVEAWNSSKPWSFNPLWSGPRNGHEMTSIATTAEWPELVMLLPVHVLALQYHSMSNILLSIYDPQLSRLGIESHRWRKKSERNIIESLRIVVALSISNESVGNAMFQACHTLSACGSYLSSEGDRDTAVDYLIRVQARIGWPTSHIVLKLRQEWQT